MENLSWTNSAKSDKPTDSNFPFIVSSGPKLQSDPSIRTLIRQQAMKTAAQRRKERGSYGRVNMGQLPILTNVKTNPIQTTVVSTGKVSSQRHQQTASEASRPSTDADLVQHDELVSMQVTTMRRRRLIRAPAVAIVPHPGTTVLFSDYEAVCSKFQVSLTDLSMLTSFSVGRGTMSALSTDPSRLMSLLGHHKWSYMQFVPSHYGYSDCLTTATDCVLAKVRSLLMPEERNKALEVKLYMRALRSLQAALQDSSACMGVDVLCATQLLSLHELLDPTRDDSWFQHVDGFIRLLKHRTSIRFETEFDKALFVAHVGQAVWEAFMSNKPCYLEDSQWLGLYQSLTQHSQVLNDRSPLAINIRTQMLMLPGLWHDIEKLVGESAWFEDDHLAKLQTRCRKVHKNLVNSLDDYKEHCTKHSLTSPLPQELAMRRELFGTVIECLAVVKRLLITLCEDERPVLEPEVQKMAQMIVDLQKEPSSKHSWLFLGHEAGVAHSVISTKDQWAKPLTYCCEHEKKLASRERYTAWLSALRSNE